MGRDVPCAFTSQWDSHTLGMPNLSKMLATLLLEAEVLRSLMGDIVKRVSHQWSYC